MLFADEQDHSYSIFKYSDQETSQLISSIFERAKSRVFKIVPAKQSSKNMKAKVCSIEKDYGRMGNMLFQRYSFWRDSCVKAVKNFDQTEAKSDLVVCYEDHVKFKRVVDIIKKLESAFKQTDFYTEIYEPKFSSAKKLKTQKQSSLSSKENSK